MKLHAWHLIIVLIALSGFAIKTNLLSAQTRPSPRTTAAQKKGSTTAPQPDSARSGAQIPQVQQAAATSPQQLPVIKLSVDQNPVEVEKELTFTLEVFGRGSLSRFEYHFVFGDKQESNWAAASTATTTYNQSHTYKYIGRDPFFVAYAEVRLSGDKLNTSRIASNRIQVFVRPPREDKPVVTGQASPSPSPSPKLSPSPSPNISPSPSAGDSPSPSPGDSATPSPGDSPTPSPGDSLSSSAGASSSASPLDSPGIPPRNDLSSSQTSPEPSPTVPGGGSGGMNPFPWVILLIAVLIALFIAYRIVKWAHIPASTFTVHPDYGGRTRFNEGSPDPLTIDFQLLLNSNVGGGNYHFHTDEPNLITYLRREND